MTIQVTEMDIFNNIKSIHYFTAADGLVGAQVGYDPLDIPPPLGLLTFCILVLQNDFTVTGKSACVDPQKFDADLGRQFAYKDAISKVWELMGYALKERLSK